MKTKTHHRAEGVTEPMIRLQRPLAPLAAMTCMALAGCGRAPAFDILGSFFPSWLICIVVGVVFAALMQRLFMRFHLDTHILWPVVVYPSLALLFACLLWLALFR